MGKILTGVRYDWCGASASAEYDVEDVGAPWLAPAGLVPRAAPVAPETRNRVVMSSCMWGCLCRVHLGFTREGPSIPSVHCRPSSNGVHSQGCAEPAWCIHNACDYKVGSRHEREQGMAGSALVRDLCDKLHQALSPDKHAVILHIKCISLHAMKTTSITIISILFSAPEQTVRHNAIKLKSNQKETQA